MKPYILCLWLCCMSSIAIAQTFQHPGILHTQTDLNRMITKVSGNVEPWKSGWDVLTASSYAQSTYSANPQASICAGSCTSGENYIVLARDCAAAYQCALRYSISGDTIYGNKAVAIMNAWANTLEEITGDTNASLRAGLYGYQFAAAGELMRGYSGWTSTEFSAFKDMLLDIFYPINTSFLQNHHGTCVDHYWANWDLANMTSILAIGVLCDDEDKFDEAVDYFKYGSGSGQVDKLVNYVYPGIPALGQGQESGRDQGHATLCISLIGAFCQIAYNQGEDLFAYDNNKVLALCEYTAKYNLGNSVPFTPYTNCENNTMTEISSSARGTERPSWELIYNHYANVKGLYAPYSKAFADSMRPEGGGGNYGTTSGGFDQLGFGTLTFTQDSVTNASIFNDTYKLIARHSGKALQTEGNGTANGTHAEQGTLSDCNCQEWVLTNTGDQKYSVQSVSSSKYLDVSGASTANGANINIWASSGNNNQRFTFNPTGDGYFRITPVHSGKAIDISSGSTSDGADAIQWTYAGSTNQQWQLAPVEELPVEEGTYTIVARHSGKALEVSGGGTTAGTAVVQSTVDGCNCQQWTLEHLYGDYYSIVGLGSQKNLGVASASLTSGAAIQIQDSTGADHQKFRIRSTGDGYFYITALHSGKTLDVSGNSQNDGASVLQWQYKASTNEQWTFTPVSGLKSMPVIVKDTSEPIKLFPNPVSTGITIDLGKENRAEAVFYDLTGKRITEISLKESKTSIDMSSFLRGFYLVVIQSDTFSYRFKIFKD